eukprot:1978878-Rhodomonas_salina.1
MSMLCALAIFDEPSGGVKLGCSVLFLATIRFWEPRFSKRLSPHNPVMPLFLPHHPQMIARDWRMPCRLTMPEADPPAFKPKMARPTQ